MDRLFTGTFLTFYLLCIRSDQADKPEGDAPAEGALLLMVGMPLLQMPPLLAVTPQAVEMLLLPMLQLLQLVVMPPLLRPLPLRMRLLLLPATDAAAAPAPAPAAAPAAPAGDAPAAPAPAPAAPAPASAAPATAAPAPAPAAPAPVAPAPAPVVAAPAPPPVAPAPPPPAPIAPPPPPPPPPAALTLESNPITQAVVATGGAISISDVVSIGSSNIKKMAANPNDGASGSVLNDLNRNLKARVSVVKAFEGVADVETLVNEAVKIKKDELESLNELVGTKLKLCVTMLLMPPKLDK